MKKLVFVTMLVVLLFSLGLTIVSASGDGDDPALCVAGQWLVVNGAKEAGVRVIVPRDTPAGNQQQGGCKTPAPAPLFVKDVVHEIGHGNTMLVYINGKLASTPSVTVSYGAVSKTLPNKGKLPLPLLFVFGLP
jgi:hypothetical protein